MKYFQAGPSLLEGLLSGGQEEMRAPRNGSAQDNHIRFKARRDRQKNRPQIAPKILHHHFCLRVGGGECCNLLCVARPSRSQPVTPLKAAAGENVFQGSFFPREAVNVSVGGHAECGEGGPLMPKPTQPRQKRSRDARARKDVVQATSNNDWKKCRSSPMMPTPFVKSRAGEGG